jgi:hypothetical protein
MIFGIDGPSFSRIPEYRIATAANFAAIGQGLPLLLQGLRPMKRRIIPPKI